MQNKFRRLRITVLVVVLVLTLGTVAFHFYGRYALDAYVASLRAQGEKVSLADLSGALPPLTNSTLEAFTNAVLKLGDAPVAATNFQRRFIKPGRLAVAHRQAAVPGMTPAKAGASWTELRQAITAHAETLDELRRLAEQPDASAGAWTNFMQRRTPYPEVRTAADWLADRALADLHDGKSTDALDDLKALAQLSNFHRDEFTLIAQMSRVNTARAGLVLTWEALQEKDWDDAQLKALQQSWQAQNFLEALERGLHAERSAGLEARRHDFYMRQPDSGESSAVPGKPLVKRLYFATVVDNDLLFHLRYLQAHIALARSLATNRPWADVAQSLDDLSETLDRRSRPPQRFFFLFTLVTTPNFKNTFRTAAHMETERRLTVTAIALRRYQLKYHKLAPGLEALAPEFFPSVPMDCMSGKPLKYQVNSDGSFTLYSVGEDGKDNAGDPTQPGQTGQTQLWEARDVVWPLAEK